MAKSNKSRYAILGMLGLFPNSSGYDIKKIMELSTEHFWKETFSSIYPILQELEQEGLIAQKGNPALSGRMRTCYSLSDSGLDQLKEWLAKPAEPEPFRHELLLKLFFGEFVQPTLNRRHIEEFQKALVAKLDLFKKIKEQLLREEKDAPSLPYWLLTLDYGLRQATSALQWCKQARKQINLMEKGAFHVQTQ